MALTTSLSIKLKHEFTITEFSQKKEHFDTDVLFTGPDDNISWGFWVNPDNDGYLSLYVGLHQESKVDEIFASGRLMIACQSANCTEDKHRILVLTNHKFSLSHIPRWGKHQFILLEQLLLPANGFIVDDKVIVSCELDIDAAKYQRSTSVKLRSLNTLAELFDTGDYGDCIIAIGRQQIKVFKDILASRSPVFAAMFEKNWKEGQLNKVTVRDVRYDVMKELIRFTCFGNVTDLKSVVKDLLIAADKYQLDELKEMCIDSLQDSLTKETFCDYVVIADRLNIDALKIAAFKVFKEHSRDIKELDGWKNFLKNQPDLTADLIASIL